MSKESMVNKISSEIKDKVSLVINNIDECDEVFVSLTIKGKNGKKDFIFSHRSTYNA